MPDPGMRRGDSYFVIASDSEAIQRAGLDCRVADAPRHATHVSPPLDSPPLDSPCANTYSGCVEQLHAVRHQLHQQFGLRPVVAAELEWYTWRAGETGPCPLSVPFEDITAWVQEAALHAGITLETIEPERGPGQLECSLPPTADPAALADALARLKASLSTVFSTQGHVASFAAKPFAETYGSALHIHLHLEDAEGNNVFWKEGDTLSPALAYALAGLLATMEQNLPIFAPTDAARARYVPGWHAPVNASWGGNNRTVALRLPDGTGSLTGASALAQASPRRARRIEHRVAGADADPHAVLAAILQGVHHGLSHQLTPPAPIHGDAAHPQYGLMPFFL